MADAHQARRARRRGGERVGPIENRAATGLGRKPVGRLREVRREMRLHWVMVVQRGRTLGSPARGAFQAALLRILHDHVGLIGIGGMVQEFRDLVDKQGI